MDIKFIAFFLTLLLPCYSNPNTGFYENCKIVEVTECEPAIDHQEIALLLLRRWEGLSLESYWDVNAYRNGWGTKAKAGEVISLQEANRRSEAVFLKVRQNIAEEYDNLDPWQISIISVMAYNVGSFGGQLDKALREGDPQRIAEVMRRYVHSNGRKLQGLVNRRNDETRLLVSCPSERLQIAEELSEIVNSHIEKVNYG